MNNTKDVLQKDYETDYSHSHCWQHNNPPCGQKIEHLKCCLCEKLNPEVEKLVERAKQEGRDEAVDYVLSNSAKEQRVRGVEYSQYENVLTEARNHK